MTVSNPHTRARAAQGPPRGKAVLTVITGPTGTDIGPVAAALGATVGDGLAIRTVVSDTGSLPLPLHVSPDPFHRHTLDPAAGCTGTADDLCSMNRVQLAALPSAWQNPDTNLGVAYSGPADSRVLTDINTLAAFGLDPSHRVTVQRRDGTGYPAGWSTSNGDDLIPEPVEVGDLAAHARDSVWRGADTGDVRHVLIEAGDGQTLLDALHIVGIAPWTPHVDAVMLWVVIDVQQAVRAIGWESSVVTDTLSPVTPAQPSTLGRIAAVATAVQAEVRRNGGPVGTSMSVALTGVETLVPGLAGRTGDVDLDMDMLHSLPVSEQSTLDTLLTACERAVAAPVRLLTTGISTAVTFD